MCDDENDGEKMLFCMTRRHVLRDFSANMRCRSSIVRYDLTTWFVAFVRSRADVCGDVKEEVKEYAFLVILNVISSVDRRRCAGFFETISAHEAFDIARGLGEGVTGIIATDVEGDVASDVDADVVINFMSVVDSIEVVSTHEIMNRERIDVVEGVATSWGTVSTHVMAEKKSFGAGVDDEAVKTFATVKKKKKDSDFDALLRIVSSCFSSFFTYSCSSIRCLSFVYHWFIIVIYCLSCRSRSFCNCCLLTTKRQLDLKCLWYSSESQREFHWFAFACKSQLEHSTSSSSCISNPARSMKFRETMKVEDYLIDILRC